jgi:hypothetical protein
MTADRPDPAPMPPRRAAPYVLATVVLATVALVAAAGWLAWNTRAGEPSTSSSTSSSSSEVESSLRAALACWRDWQGLSAAMMQREAALPSLAQRLLEFVTSRL